MKLDRGRLHLAGGRVGSTSTVYVPGGQASGAGPGARGPVDHTNSCIHC